MKGLELRRLSWIILVGPINHERPCKREARRSGSGGSDGFADGGRDPEPRNVGGLWKLEMARKQISP